MRSSVQTDDVLQSAKANYFSIDASTTSPRKRPQPVNSPLPSRNATTTALPRSPQFINLYGDAPVAQTPSDSSEVTAGLREEHATISPKYFYNPLGSKLFEAITGLDEYYPTRTEAGIFQAHQKEMVAAITAAGVTAPCLIDLGAGNCAKALSFMPHLKPQQYVPIDISVEFLRDAAAQVQKSFPSLDIVGLGMDFSSSLELPSVVQAHDRVFFYPGSSLGNFHPDQALAFLSRIADSVQERSGGLLLGIDLVKDTSVLEAAYDDAVGVTAAFNKNVLRNVNELLAADFDLRQWDHVALFNSHASRIEMHLQARRDLCVGWPGNERRFAEGERILTECSYKYTVPGMTGLLKEAGFRGVQHWRDPEDWFAVFWASV
jgi:dimethylhistidine N-methyltransferase